MQNKYRKVLLHSEELRDLAEFAVAAVGALEVAVHRDDALGLSIGIRALALNLGFTA